MDKATWTASSRGADTIVGRPLSSTATTVTWSAPTPVAASTASFAAVVIAALPVRTGGLSGLAAGSGDVEAACEVAPETVQGGGAATVVVGLGGAGGGPHAVTPTMARARMAAVLRRIAFALLADRRVRDETAPRRPPAALLVHGIRAPIPGLGDTPGTTAFGLGLLTSHEARGPATGRGPRRLI